MSSKYACLRTMRFKLSATILFTSSQSLASKPGSSASDFARQGLQLVSESHRFFNKYNDWQLRHCGTSLLGNGLSHFFLQAEALTQVMCFTLALMAEVHSWSCCYC